MKTDAPSPKEGGPPISSNAASGEARPPAARLSFHILPSAGTMVGVCATLIGLVKIAETSIGPSIVDQCFALAALVFLVSAFTSYMSMRVESESRFGAMLERVADWCFMVGLIGLAFVALLFAYETI